MNYILPTEAVRSTTPQLFFLAEKESILWWDLCQGRQQSAKCLQIFKLGMRAHFFEVLGETAYLQAREALCSQLSPRPVYREPRCVYQRVAEERVSN